MFLSIEGKFSIKSYNTIKELEIPHDLFIEFCQIEHFNRLKCNCVIFKRSFILTMILSIEGKFSKRFD